MHPPPQNAVTQRLDNVRHLGTVKNKMNHLQEQSHTISASLKKIRPLFVPNPVGGVGTRRAPKVPLAMTKRKQAAPERSQ